MTVLKTPHNPLDQVTLVNANDEVIGKMDKIEAHRGAGKRHRAISVYLFRNTTTQQPNNLTTQLLIQQRSDKKIVGAHQWANTVCGNVRPNETYEQCAYRRLKEELGINLFSPPLSAVALAKEDEGRIPSPANAGRGKKGAESELSLTPIYKFEYHLRCNEEFGEWEIDQVYVGWYDGQVKPNPDEVQDYAWADLEEVKRKIKNGKKGKFGEIEIFIQQSPQAHNNTLVPKEAGTTQQLTLAPWFVYMLGDDELQEKLKQFAGL